jgi:hypothetical protein
LSMVREYWIRCTFHDRILASRSAGCLFTIINYLVRMDSQLNAPRFRGPIS